MRDNELIAELQAIVTAKDAIINAQAKRIVGLEAALGRLGSVEAFGLAMVIDGHLAEEVRLRMDFARNVLRKEANA